MSLLGKRKDKGQEGIRVQRITWDSKTRMACVHYRRGGTRHKLTFHADSLEEVETIIENIGE